MHSFKKGVELAEGLFNRVEMGLGVFVQSLPVGHDVTQRGAQRSIPVARKRMRNPRIDVELDLIACFGKIPGRDIGLPFIPEQPENPVDILTGVHVELEQQLYSPFPGMSTRRHRQFSRYR